MLKSPSKEELNHIRLLIDPSQPIPDWPLKDPNICSTNGDITVIATNFTEKHLAALYFWLNIPFQCLETSSGITWPFTEPSLETMAEVFMMLFGAFVKGGNTSDGVIRP